MTKQQGAGMPMQTKWKIVPVEPTEYMLKAACIAPNGTKRGKLGDLLRIEYTAMLSAAPPCEDLETVRAALEAARQFIDNGVALGFIRMPDADVPDPAHNTSFKIDEALAALGRIRGEG